MDRYFRYKLINKNGRMEGGIRKFPHDNAFSTITMLERGGGTVLFSEPLPNILGILYGYFERFLHGKVTRLELAESLGNMSVMLKAGLPLHIAIEDTFIGNSNKALVRTGRALLVDVENGLSVSEAAALHEDVFPNLVIYLMRLGEETGCLDRTINDAASHIQRMDTIISQTKRALIMPAFTLSAIFGAMLFWLYLVVPQMKELFHSFNVELPPLTLAVIEVASFLEENLVSILLGLVIVPIVISTLIRVNQKIRYYFHTLLYHTPIIKTVVQASMLAFISEYLSLMANAGVDMVRSLDIMRETISNELYKEKVGDVRRSVSMGLTLRESFAGAGVFPTFVVRMIGVGEQSGTVDTQLNYVSVEYQRRLTNTVDSLGKLIEPIAVLLGGGFFALLAASMFLPIYSMIGDIM